MISIASIRRPTVEHPDRDWQELRDSIVEQIDGTWTDHNPSDPGVTIAESIAMSLADIHFRIADRSFADHHLVSGAWQDGHWSGIDIGDPDALAAVAVGLAGPDPLGSGDPALVAVRRIAAAANNTPEAVQVLVAAGVDRAMSATWIRLVREPIVRRVVLDHRPVIVAAVDATTDVRGARLALRADPSCEALWDDELDALVAMEQRRRRTDTIVAASRRVADRTESGDVLFGELTADPSDQLTDIEALTAIAAHPCPADWLPERFERPDGTTRVWPPHPLQARLCEPVTADDYTRMARQHPEVRRAWVRPGRFEGVGWDGRPVSADEPDALGAITIVVERDGPPTHSELFLRRVLATFTELDDPYALLRNDLDLLTPRRVVCDEVGATLLKQCDIEVKAVLHVAVGTIDDRTIPIEAAADRVRRYFAEGRPESRPHTAAEPECPHDLDGPWPLPDSAPVGWSPGEPIRMSELIAVLGDSPLVLGVEDVQIRRHPAGPWIAADRTASFDFEIDRVCVPQLTSHCITVTFDLGGVS